MKYVPLGDVAELNPTWDKTARPHDPVSFVSMASMNDVAGKTVREEHRTVDQVRKGYTPFKRDDLLIAKITPCFENGKIGRASITNQLGAGSTEFHVVRPGPELDGSYALHFLRGQRFRTAGELRMTGSGGQRRVPLAYVAEFQLPLPGIEEQRRIAAILDKADELRAKRRQAIARLDALTQSIFHSMFGDPVQNPYGLDRVSLTEIGRLYSGGTPSKEVADNWTGSTPWFSPKDLKKARLFDSLDHISPQVPANTSLRLLPIGTVVFVVRGMILAHSFPVALLECEATINQDLKAILPTKEVVPEFLLACLQAQQKYVVGLVETAAHGTKKVTTETLNKAWVFDVNLELQQTFANRVAAVERLKETHRKHLAELDALFASLQSRAFKGEL